MLLKKKKTKAQRGNKVYFMILRKTVDLLLTRMRSFQQGMTASNTKAGSVLQQHL